MDGDPLEKHSWVVYDPHLNLIDVDVRYVVAASLALNEGLVGQVEQRVPIWAERRPQNVHLKVDRC